MRICAREMTDQGAHRSGRAIEYERKMRGDELIRRRACHNRGEWVCFDEAEQGRNVFLGKGTRYVHDACDELVNAT